MKDDDYKKMIDMLIMATVGNKIEWRENAKPTGSYETSVAGCGIKIWTDYDIQFDDTSYSISLANPDGRVFSTYSYNEADNTEEYQHLGTLYNAIRDMVYRITESENLILNGLRNMTENKLSN